MYSSILTCQYSDDVSDSGQYLTWRIAPVFLCFSRQPENGSPESKHVVGDTHHELYLAMCVLSYFTEFIYL